MSFDKSAFFVGAEGGARTRMMLPSRDFKSLVSAIPPLRRDNNYSMGDTVRQDLQGGFGEKVAAGMASELQKMGKEYCKMRTYVL